MTGSTKQGSRLTKALRASAIALLVLAAGCGQEVSGGDPKISADDDRGAGGVLEGIKIKGSKFTPNGEVVVTALLVGNGPSPSQYVEEKIQADSDGKIERLGQVNLAAIDERFEKSRLQLLRNRKNRVRDPREARASCRADRILPLPVPHICRF